MGLPVPEQRPGDCYVWGSSDTSTGAVCDRQQSASPVIVDDSTHLDVCQVCTAFYIRQHCVLETVCQSVALLSMSCPDISL